MNSLTRLRKLLEILEDIQVELVNVNWPEEDVGEQVPKEVEDFLENHVYDGDWVDALIDPIKERLSDLIGQIERGSGKFKNPGRRHSGGQ